MLAIGAALVVVMAALAAVSPTPWAETFRAALAPVCHQMPERSFALAGSPVGLCHRCTAVLAALAIMLSVPLAAARWIPPMVVLGVAVGPMVFDWGIDALGFWTNTMASRVVTGVWAGVVVGLLIGTTAGGTGRGDPPDRPSKLMAVD